MMTKFMLTVIVGVFVAAFAVEMIGRRRRRVRPQLGDVARDFRRGFAQGYRRETNADQASIAL
jgi:hypothetical protein